jgi:hypothetical protein
MKCAQGLTAEHMVRVAEEELLNRRLLKPADVLGVVAGTSQTSGSTNFMRLHTVTAEAATAAAMPKGKRTPRPRKL